MNIPLSQLLIGIGAALLALGLLLKTGERYGLMLFRLPGDLKWESSLGSFHFPLVSCLVLSALLTLLARWFRG